MQPTLCSYPSRSRSEGFSLVELVVVITLLGLLCSLAIPRFTRLENDARASEVLALSLNLRSASDLSSFTVSSSPTSVTFSKTGAQAAAQCAVTYRVSPAAPSAAAITELYRAGC